MAGVIYNRVKVTESGYADSVGTVPAFIVEYRVVMGPYRYSRTPLAGRSGKTLRDTEAAHVAPVRRELGVKTFFNMLGPMVNPSFPSRQLIGVYSLELARIYSYLYQGTGNIGECLAFGRVSGRNAADETRWS